MYLSRHFQSIDHVGATCRHRLQIEQAELVIDERDVERSIVNDELGAANELDTALLVNPHDIDGMARTMAMALSMPLTERRMRWEAMMTKLRGNTIRQWFASFVYTLQDEVTAKVPPVDPAIGADPQTLWQLRSVNSSARLH